MRLFDLGMVGCEVDSHDFVDWHRVVFFFWGVNGIA